MNYALFMVYLYRVCVDPFFVSDSELARLCGLITPARLERAARIKDVTAKWACIAVELMLCFHMQRAGLKKGGFPLDIVTDKNGKPRFNSSIGDMPFFSFSHSRNTALCAVADCEIGADIEKLRDIEAKKGLFEYIHSGGDDTPSLIHAWSAKEAYLKLTGEGLFSGLKPSDLRVSDNTVYNATRGDSACLLQFGDEGFVISVCTRNKRDAEYAWLSLTEDRELSLIDKGIING